jgi:hypothetical protein
VAVMNNEIGGQNFVGHIQNIQMMLKSKKMKIMLVRMKKQKKYDMLVLM